MKNKLKLLSIVLTIVFVIGSLFTGSLGDIQKVMAAVIFSDSFETGSSSNWTPTQGTWSVVDDSGNKVYYMSNGSEGRTSAGSQTWSDYSVQARVKIERLGNGDNRAYVAGRYVDGNNYYAASLYRNANSGKPTIEIRKKVSGTSTTLASKSYTVNTNTWYTVKLEMVGTTLNMYVNGNLELSATDSSLSGGGCGFSYNTSIYNV